MRHFAGVFFSFPSFNVYKTINQLVSTRSDSVHSDFGALQIIYLLTYLHLTQVQALILQYFLPRRPSFDAHNHGLWHLSVCAYLKSIHTRVALRNVKCRPIFNLVDGVFVAGGFVILHSMNNQTTVFFVLCSAWTVLTKNLLHFLLISKWQSVSIYIDSEG